MKKLLSIAVVEHDSNMSYFDGEQLHYIKLERLKQIKHYCYPTLWDWKYDIEKIWGVELSDIDEIVVDFSHKIYLDKSLPESMKDVLSGKTNYTLVDEDSNYLTDIFKVNNLVDKKIPVWYIGHHYAHSQSTWMLSENVPDVAIVIDGIGDSRTWSVFRNEKLIDHGNIDMGSIGFEMVNAGKYLGIKSFNDVDIAGKVMGLQSYGNVDQEYLNFLRNFNYRQISEIFNHAHWVDHKKDELLARLTPLDWIRTVHLRIGEVLVELFKTYVREDETISYSGGVAQNIIWNTELKKHFPNLIIPPHSGDEGLSLGAIEWLRKKNNMPTFNLKNFPYCQQDILPEVSVTSETIKKTAKLLSEGKIVGWYQGHGEIGPRALGNRSVLMDPRSVNGKTKMNSVKKRENYRPFGASILEKHATKLLDLAKEDKYMLYSSKIISDDYPAITHVDGTCRVQIVTDENKIFKELLEEFYKLTGCPILMNTSLNIAGMPMAAYPEIVVDIFKSTAIDCVVIGNAILCKDESTL
jgi:carbamoyltransferase